MSATVSVALIVCAARNGVIGRGGRMPWRMPSDLKHFKALTVGKPVVMGRKTFGSIGKALPGRVNIVITRQAGLTLPDATVVADLAAGLAEGRRVAEATGAGEVMVIGGGEIYAQALPVAQRVYFTRLCADVEGDAVFPALPDCDWTVVSRAPLQTTPKDDFAAEVVVYERRA